MSSPTPGPRTFDLEERTLTFAKLVRKFVKQLPRTVCNQEDVKQLARSSGSIEANEGLGKKDFRMHVRIARKEAKESRYWLRLLDTGECEDAEAERNALIQETTELIRILAAILNKCG